MEVVWASKTTFINHTVVTIENNERNISLNQTVVGFRNEAVIETDSNIKYNVTVTEFTRCKANVSSSKVCYCPNSMDPLSCKFVIKVPLKQ